MKIINIVKIAFKSFSKHKIRSVLSIIGIIIGIITIIVVMTISENLKIFISNEYDRIGTNMLWITISKNTNIENSILTNADLDSLSKIQGIDNISPNLIEYSTINQNNANGDVRIIGVSDEFEHIRKLPVNGQFISKKNIVNEENVCVISNKIREKFLYKNINPIGEKIMIKNHEFVVIGYIDKPETNTVTNFDNPYDVYVPYSIMEKYFGINGINYILLSVDDENKINQYKVVLTQKLLILKGKDAKYDIDSLIENKERFELIFNIVIAATALLTSISLIVSGIGIMNVLLMSINERKWEIGLRKAVGAKNNDIVLQFLFESLIYSVVGIFIGILISILLIMIINQISPVTLKISYLSLVLSTSFCTIINLMFGLLPAIKASKMDPLECLE
ncbi:ABC transporter permease [Abyssisolibacter fermentans]|uniref:ABC transporter permease n=1 Tax=Abyssisolibacter fermentans TaxID=1766203 RepID=UPI00082C8474|nr:ABC transporter permease [Abyssisolibacter fermentans]